MNKNLKDLCNESVLKLSRTIELMEVLDEILDGERKSYTILMCIKENVKSAFENIEYCKTIISNED